MGAFGDGAVGDLHVAEVIALVARVDGGAALDLGYGFGVGALLLGVCASPTRFMGEVSKRVFLADAVYGEGPSGGSRR
ncbi:TPA: hypothetical protein NBQ01_002159 [Corynebacterium striatum]|nr:hypothetical protein [Corynebacterium striatum]